MALCFSEKYDDLYMWKSYADGGIAIGFDLESIENWIKNIHYFNEMKKEKFKKKDQKRKRKKKI